MTLLFQGNKMSTYLQILATLKAVALDYKARVILPRDLSVS